MLKIIKFSQLVVELNFNTDLSQHDILAQLPVVYRVNKHLTFLHVLIKLKFLCRKGAMVYTVVY